MRRYSTLVRGVRAVAIASFLALGLLISIRYQQVTETFGTATSAQRIAASTTQLLSLAKDLDEAARGYVITGREDMLAGDARTRSLIGPEIDRLQQAIPNEPDQQRRAQRFVDEFTQVTASSERLVTARREQGFDAARDVMLGQGEAATLNGLRQTGDELAAAARQRVLSERAATRQSRTITGYLMLASFLLAIGMLAYAGFLVRRELRQRTAAEEALRRSNDEIEQQVADRTRDLVAANAKLESRERRLRMVADFGVVHLFTTNNRGGANYISAGFCVTTGLDPAQVLGMGWTAAIHPGDRDAVLGLWPRSLPNAAAFETDFRLRTATGVYRGFKMRVMPATDASGQVTEWFGAMIDLHDQQTADRLKDDLLATVSHELRTPLNAIVGWTHILKIDKGENRVRAVEAIERNAFVQTRLIDDLLDVSKMTKGQFTLTVSTIDLRTVVQAALVTIGPAAAAKGVTIQVRSTEDVRIRGDEARLQQVAWNLLSNAVKFTPKGGHVTIDVSRLGNRAQLRVTDTGEGIEPAFLPHVFEPFRQGESRSTRLGLGLGLAIVRQIVELHGGSVLATSDGAQRGSSFTVVLPMSPAGVLPAAPPASGDTRDLNLRVLVVEDDEDAVTTLSTLLRYRGCEVRAAHTVREALELFQSWNPDVMICDIGLPDGDGCSLLRQVRELMPDRSVPAIAVSAFAREEDRRRAAGVGFEVYLTKPFEVEQLVDHIRQVAKAG
ncbi:MAG TPA: ATP-binding protein [Vicinamibacterales bacterium]|nr:ATP-binding protein [Vicinamibacterales bacterium]